jgi:hypothetical protein
MSVHVFGIRHHGPGSARSLRQALAALAPDILLVEGPPEGDGLLPLVTSPQMQPPVALLIYRPDQPAQTAVYPFALFSPEWQAITYALQQGIPVQFMDLPLAQMMALSEPTAQDESAPASDAKPPEWETAVTQDPLRWLAEAAGDSDGEAWWERMVEQRQHSDDLFTAILEAMSALRQIAIPPDSPWQRQEQWREAAMRQTIRAAQRAGYGRIAVVCGAWHAPVLADMPASAQADRDLLKGLAKVKVAATWIPWSYSRLTAASGYGAGVTSPRWYEHLWHHPQEAVYHWCIAAAHLLRGEGFAASTAQVIDTARLAHTLSAVRHLPTPGLRELLDAVQTTLAAGQSAPMLLVQRQLIVGNAMGAVPPEAPTVPLQQDLTAWQKRLRLPVTETEKSYDLDLRQPNDLARSHLWHRLLLLDIPWGQPGQARRAKGTFHEVWRVQWPPELAVRVVEAAVWGNTVAEAAAARAVDLAQKTTELPTLTRLAQQVLLADLPAAAAAVVVRLENLAALTRDTAVLMDTLPELAHILRYGNVRQTDAAMVSQVVDGIVPRICIGLPGACLSLNDEAADAMNGRLGRVAEAIHLLQENAHLIAWQETIRKLAAQADLHGLLAGHCCRMLFDAGVEERAETARRMSFALSPANEPAQAAAWLDGFLRGGGRGSGALLLHDAALWQIVDQWLGSLAAAAFQAQLPLLRRTFASFPAAERRQLGEQARRGRPQTAAMLAPDHVDMTHVPLALAVAAQLLGLEAQGVTDG